MPGAAEALAFQPEAQLPRALLEDLVGAGVEDAHLSGSVVARGDGSGEVPYSNGWSSMCIARCGSLFFIGRFLGTAHDTRTGVSPLNISSLRSK